MQLQSRVVAEKINAPCEIIDSRRVVCDRDRLDEVWLENLPRLAAPSEQGQSFREAQWAIWVVVSAGCVESAVILDDD